MATVTMNRVEFEVVILDGEVFYQSIGGRVHHQTMAKILRDHFSDTAVGVYDPRNGVISDRGPDAEFWAKVWTAPTFDDQLDVLFA